MISIAKRAVPSAVLAIGLLVARPAGADALTPCAPAARKDAAAAEPYQQEANASAYRLAADGGYRLAAGTEYRLAADTPPRPAPRCETAGASASPPVAAAPEFVPEFRPAAAGGAYHKLINSTARTVGIQADLIHAVITVESAYDADAISPKGAQGLMQLMPATAALYTVGNPYDPGQNVKAGARYLRYLLTEFDNDLKLALAAYNSGPETVRKYRSIPPYPETRDYVQRVLRNYHSRLNRSSTIGQ